MPTHSLHHSYPESYEPPKKYVLVLSCVDARLLDDLVSFLDHDNLTNRYYHVTLPGTALGLTERWKEDQPEPCDGGEGGKKSDRKPCFIFDLPEQFARWRKTFIDQVNAAIILTKGEITDVYIIQHEDCGAFRAYIQKDSSEMSDEYELQLHKQYAEALVQDIADRFYSEYNPKDTDDKFAQEKLPRLHAFYMDLRGHVQHLSTYSDEGSKESKKPTKKAPPKPSNRKKAT